MEKITGTIKRYVYKNEENGYKIAKVELENKSVETLVGYFPELSQDVIYDFFGEWIRHQSYGLQFKLDSFYKSEQQTIDGLISYLSSSFFKGIGPVTATKIVDHLGNDAINKIIENHTVLKEIGFKNDKSLLLQTQLKEHQEIEHLLIKLYNYQLSGKMAMKLINYYQNKTIQVLEENPYQLIEDIEGIGFLKADEIAFKIGIEKDDPKRVKAAIIYTLKTIAYQNGDMYLDKESIFKYTTDVLKIDVDINEVLNSLVEDRKLILEEDRYYLELAYFTEESVANNMMRLNTNVDDEIDFNYLETLLNQYELMTGINYTDEQKEAIIESFKYNLYIITGGPGTGKTTIIDGILKTYQSYFELDMKKHLLEEKIALMAPTGRAAKRMKELLDFDAKTIHRHLGYGYDGYFSFDEYNKLPHDLIIIDESSMIDIYLAHRLFSSIKDGAKVIIVGDVDQLPSVSPGQVLKDLIESEVIKTKRLTHIHRQAEGSNIIDIAFKVNNKLVEYEDLYSKNDVYFYKCHFDQVKSIILKQLEGALQQGYDMINDIQVLIPQYKGELGIDLINEAIQERFNKNRKLEMNYGSRKYFIGDKVIQLTNDPEKGIMNGDIGVITKIGIDEDNNKVMIVNFIDTEAIYSQEDLEDLNLAYAMSIHKSQGSEYKIVIIPMVKSYMHMLKKELIYTAITRAKQYLIFLGDIPLLVYASNNLVEMRKTTLKNKIINFRKGDN